MVKDIDLQMSFAKLFLWLQLLCFFCSANAQNNDVKVTSEIDQDSAYADQPITGTVTVTHDKKTKVDPQGFLLDKNPLKVTFVKEVNIDPILLSIYSFTIHPQSQGLYFLPSITAVVDGKKYQSSMTSYTVNAANTKPATTPTPPPPSSSLPTPTQSPATVNQDGKTSQKTPAKSDVEPLLKLEAGIQGNSALYPGQRTKLVYHYFFRGNIGLTKEVLPLMDAAGMIKIGEKEFKNYTQDDLSVNEVSQEVEAIKVGTFSFGPSIAEGYAYEVDASGKTSYTSPKLTSEAPPVVITVLPFPEENKPASFNGAVGHYLIKTSLKSPPKANIDDEVSLLIEIMGQGNIKSVPIPDISIQPGFNGFFRINDLPPIETVTENEKQAVIVMHPLSDEIKEIPSVEFSYFDPNDAKYVTLHSPPIPITISTFTPPASDKSSKPKRESPSLDSKTTSQLITPKPIDIASNSSLSASDLYNRPFGTWWVFALIPLGIAVLIYQADLQDFLQRQRLLAPMLSSQQLFEETLTFSEGSPAYFDGLVLAIKQALVEKGLISSIKVSDDTFNHIIDSEPEIKACLFEIEKIRYAGKGKVDFASLRSQVERIVKQSNGVKT